MKRLRSGFLVATVLLGAYAWGFRPAGANPVIRPLVSAPLHIHGHFVTLPITINGKGPFLFAIDTGAGGQARVKADIAKALHLPVIGEVRARGLGSRELTESIVSMSVSMDHVQVKDVQAAVSQRGYPHGVDGILAFGFFKNYILSIDYPRDRFELLRGSITAKTANAVAFSMPRGIPQVFGSVAGTKVPFDIDTGSSGGIGLGENLRVPLATEPKVVGRACGMGGCVDVKSGVVSGNLQIDGIRLAHPTVDLLPLPGAHVGNLGYHFLRAYHIAFDQHSGYTIIEP